MLQDQAKDFQQKIDKLKSIVYNEVSNDGCDGEEDRRCNRRHDRVMENWLKGIKIKVPYFLGKITRVHI